MQLQIRQIEAGHYALQGKLDVSSLRHDWRANRGQKLAPMAQKLTLDLAGIDSADSAGLAWLINMVRDCRQDNIQLCLCNMPQSLLKLAKISDVEHFLPLQ